MFSDVRLVIWDLDETFWHGTLTEGGIQYSPENHATVVELCRRGIISSICSKNDLKSVQEVLLKQGLWDYFVFPSIDWSEKGARVAAIVEAVQLRPESILFVDDNAANRAQVKAVLPGIQVADEQAVPGLLADPALAGKDDTDLTRLKHYKVLERRLTDFKAGEGNSVGFLRQSAIHVEIIHDVERHLERAIELINRTNQLNFTKLRLSDDKGESARQLLEQISPWHVKAGLVSVRDCYGDYGICGFFLVEGMAAWGAPKLKHFAFSCRTLGLGVEQWIYQLLGRPDLKVVGKVMSDLSLEVDWINTSVSTEKLKTQGSRRIKEVRIRGGCELEVLEHFFRASAEKVVMEVITMRSGLYRPAHHSTVLAQAFKSLLHSEAALLPALGMDETFFQTGVFDSCEDGTLIIYSPTGDANHKRYQHKKIGFKVPIWFRENVLPANLSRSDADRETYDSIIANLTADYETIPVDDIGGFADTYKEIIDRVPNNGLLVIVLPNCRHKINGVAVENTIQRRLNIAFSSAAEGLPNVRLVAVEHLVQSIDEIADSYLHFDRAVYHRLYEAIMEQFQDWLASSRHSTTASASPGWPDLSAIPSLVSRLRRRMSGAWSR